MADDLPLKISEALIALADDAPLREGAVLLLNTLGYASNRTADAGNVQEFLERFRPEKPLSDKQRGLFDDWRRVEIVFQVTGDEIEFSPDKPGLFDGPGFDQGRAKSFLFLAVDMRPDTYSRALLAETTRTVNRLFRMPIIIVFRYGSALTLAAVHRRASRRDDNRDVLEKVTLVKDISLKNPHRAHIEILGDLALTDLIQAGVRSFDDLHMKWEQVLDLDALNKRFYKELFGWFERAVEECRFPYDGAGDGCAQRHVIRLITRLLFIWFLKEKNLVPEYLFREAFAREVLNDYSPDNTDYYCAVLQNLFFATLNTEIPNRAFIKKSNASNRDFNKYRYRNMLRDSDGFIETMKQVPFVNGGLFDCLDDFAPAEVGGRRIDAFTDSETQSQDLYVPARLLLDEESGLFALFRHYKFTIEENTPLDTEVALDPELLGRAFENLLAAYNPETRETARKATGSYYTPRPVVDYMVREALTEALAAKAPPADDDPKFWRERIDYLLDHSAAMDDAPEFFSATEKCALVAAVADLRTLDPAVGSGAFPMGILQTLTMALRRLDPDNTLWETLQKDRAAARAGQAFGTEDRRQRDDELAEISATFDKYRQSDFGRKLYLIQNGIYGVDIQPIACQIAKLRFFISLAIEQSPDPTTPNLGIKPLPNLETRFVAADTLIGLRNEMAPFLLDDRVVSKRKEVAAIRERYFLADSRPKKLECIETEQRLREELRSVLESERGEWIAAQERAIEDKAEGVPRPEAREKFRDRSFQKLATRRRAFDANLADARKVAEWDPYDQNGCAAWFAPEYMFGISGGFDVVIGNPPYIQLQKDGGLLGNRYKDAGYETFARTGDIYQLFFERGCGLLRTDEGVLAYITSNSWLKAKYGEPLRRWFVQRHTPLRLMEMGKDVFENAIVDTAVMIVRSSKERIETCRAVDVEQVSDGQFPPPKANWGTLQPKGDRPWMALSPKERAVMEKMEAVGTPLKEWDISIYYGIKTGFNDAFIIDQATHDALVAEDPRSAELLRPILRGRDIARYRANWAGLWLLSTFPSLDLDIDAYPAIKQYLLSFGKERLVQEGRRLPGGSRSRKKTTNAWYELQDTCAYHTSFALEKVVWIELVDRGRFAYDESGMLIEATAFMITGERVKYLCAILNSRLVHWYILKMAPTSGMGIPRWKKVYVESIPVAMSHPSVAAELRSLVDTASSNASPNEKRRAQIEKRIDTLVYQAYGISADEEKLIEMTIKI